jgi:hypothetical protein
MGYARVVSGGPDGRYVIALDYGEDTKTQVLQALAALLAQIDANLVTAQLALADGVQREDELTAQIAAAIEELVALQQSLPPGSPPGDDTLLKYLLAQRRKLQTTNFPLRYNIDALKFRRRNTLQMIAYWRDIAASETRNAWCADLTEDREPGSLVSTLEIPGDSSLILIAPGAVEPSNDDGYLAAREIMSPAQAFFNAAILPGWAKFLPTYRWGTLTAVNYDDDTATVQLADATLTGQRLSVNQESTLTDIPVVYMTCDSSTFEAGDRVVVQFQGQDWSDPRVVGYLDNPRPCNWVCRGSTGVTAIFESMVPAIMTSISGTSLDIRGRINGGSWYTLLHAASTSDYNLFESPNESDDVGSGIPEYEVYIYPNSLPGSVTIPAIVCNCHPPVAAIGSTDLALRHKAEIAIYVSGEIVFNVAFTDGGWTGSVQRADGIYVKTPGGIAVETPPHSGTIQVKRLTSYTLISEA